MSDAISGVGTSFERGDGTSNESFTAISEVRRIAGPSMSRDFYDVTNLDSTGGWREYISGFRDGGQLTLTVNFTLDAFDDLFEDFQDDDAHNYRIVFPDTGETTFTFSGFVTEMPINIVPDDAITFDVTFKLDGQPTLSS